MSTAQNTPVRRPAPEMSTADAPLKNQAPQDISLGTDLDHEQVIVPADERMAHKDYLAELAFGEEPVNIIIAKGAEKLAPSTVMVAVNGKGAEVFMNGKWCEMTWVPVGRMLTMKRKYVEVLIRSKTDDVSTEHGSREDKNPYNNVVHANRMNNQVSVVGDQSPRAVQWFEKLMSEL